MASNATSCQRLTFGSFRCSTKIPLPSSTASRRTFWRVRNETSKCQLVSALKFVWRLVRAIILLNLCAGYTSLLRLRFNGRRVHANEAYKEYIQERHHIHMNSTVWETLTEFVHWLGQNNICKIDKTEKGWFVTYIDHNPWQIGKVPILQYSHNYKHIYYIM